MSTTERTIESMIKAIIADGCGVYTNDAGNGCGGPGFLGPQELEEMLEADDFAEFEIIGHRTWDNLEATSEIISNTLRAHDHKPDGTKWIVAEKVEFTDGCQNNPHRVHLLLWEA
jgi:hypothetical protein